MSDLTVFEFESHEVRFVGTADDPWWVASDLCLVLGLDNVSKALSRLDEDEKRDDITISDVIGRSQSVWCVNESGMYSLILTSRKAQAKRFKKWVTSVVLPSIRKTGKYELKQITESIPSIQQISELYDLTLAPAGIDPKLIAGVKLNAIASYNPTLLAAAEMGKSLLSISVEDELIRPTQLGEKLEVRTGEKWSAIRVNKLLIEQGFQMPNPDGKEPTYLPTEKGKPHSKMMLDTAKGRNKTIQSLRWYPSILEALEVGA